MTNQEAIKHIKRHKIIHRYKEPRAIYVTEALDMAIAALEKGIPKPVTQPIYVGGHLMGGCPNCCKVLNIQDNPVYCGGCGQKVKWDD